MLGDSKVKRMRIYLIWNSSVNVWKGHIMMHDPNLDLVLDLDQNFLIVVWLHLLLRVLKLLES